jgi:manganese/zinc/iron transport system substrate-binding protein
MAWQQKTTFPWGAALFFIGAIAASFAVILRYSPCLRSRVTPGHTGSSQGSVRLTPDFRPNAGDANQALVIVCSTGIIADMVAAIGGEQVQVAYLMGPGVDPHIYRARASDMQLLAGAQLIFYHGLHLEGKMATLFERMSRDTENRASSVLAVAVADAIPKNLLQLADDGVTYDPHVWHDVQLWQYAAQCVCSTLVEVDPAHNNYYQERFAKYQKELQALDQYIKNQVAQIPENQRVLITAHDAFGYFGRAYGFQVVGLQGISTDSEISMHDIQRVADIIVEHGVPAIFLESLIPERTLQAVKQAVAARGRTVIFGQELFSDALGDAVSGADTYVGMMRHNAGAIAGALSPRYAPSIQLLTQSLGMTGREGTRAPARHSLATVRHSSKSDGWGDGGANGEEANAQGRTALARHSFSAGGKEGRQPDDRVRRSLQAKAEAESEDRRASSYAK